MRNSPPAFCSQRESCGRAPIYKTRFTTRHQTRWGNVLNVTLSETVKFVPAAAQRFGTISTSCGLCGKTSIEFIRQQFPPIDFPAREQIDSATLLQLPERLRNAQGNFARTGGIHAAAIFDLRGDLVVLREDIGRHNAVDKVIGRAFLDEMVPLKNTSVARERTLVVRDRAKSARGWNRHHRRRFCAFVAGD